MQKINITHEKKTDCKCPTNQSFISEKYCATDLIRV